MTTNLSYNTSTISLIIDGNWKLQKLISVAGRHQVTGYRLERCPHEKEVHPSQEYVIDHVLNREEIFPFDGRTLW